MRKALSILRDGISVEIEGPGVSLDGTGIADVALGRDIQSGGAAASRLANGAEVVDHIIAQACVVDPRVGLDEVSRAWFIFQ